MNATAEVYVLVCGNTDRGDDGAAIRAVGTLIARRADHFRRVRFVRCGQLDFDDLLDVPPFKPVVIADAAAGVPAGSVVTLPLDHLIDNPRGPGPRSSHALPINQVLGVANVLSPAPLAGLFVGVGGAQFDPGDRLSPAVTRSMRSFGAAIEAAIDGLMPAATDGTGVPRDVH